jgi:hypothetical protein
MAKRKKDQLVNWGLLINYLGRLAKALKWPAVILLSVAIVSLAVAKAPSSFHVNNQLILDYISVLRWPVIAVAVILLLRPHLPELVGRIREFGLGNSRLKFDSSQSQQPTSALDLKEADDEADDPVAPEEDSSGGDDLQVLLTSPQAVAAYEQVYREIFGTQLEVLKRLLSYIGGLGTSQLQDIFDEHRRKAFAAGSTPYQNPLSFMQFLLDNILVLHEPDTGLFKLTNAGSYFLQYLMKQSLLSREKPF